MIIIPRPCKTCEHPRRLEIDSDLMLKKPLNVIARKYDVAYQSLKRHRSSNHHGQDVEMIREKYIAAKGKKFIDTISLYDELLLHYLNNPDIKQQLTIDQVLRVISARSAYLGETKAPPRVEIRWGIGLKDEPESDQIKIQIPVKKKVEDVKSES